jgi:hypothetical protein
MEITVAQNKITHVEEVDVYEEDKSNLTGKQKKITIRKETYDYCDIFRAFEKNVQSSLADSKSLQVFKNR